MAKRDGILAFIELLRSRYGFSSWSREFIVGSDRFLISLSAAPAGLSMACFAEGQRGVSFWQSILDDDAFNMHVMTHTNQFNFVFFIFSRSLLFILSVIRGKS